MTEKQWQEEGETNLCILFPHKISCMRPAVLPKTKVANTNTYYGTNFLLF